MRASKEDAAALARRAEMKSAALAMHHEEATRARGWSGALALLATTALGFIPFLGGSPGMQALGLGCMGLLAVICWWTRWKLRSDEGYTLPVYLIFGWGQVLCAIGVTYYLGVFSPTPVAVGLGIQFLGLSGFRRHWFLLAGVPALAWLTMGTAITAGWLVDRGLYPSSDVSRLGLIFMVTCVPMVYLMTAWMARLSRRSMLEAIRRSNELLRLANQREAQLVEAQQDLEKVLRAGAGKTGRYSGARAGRWLLAELVGRGAMGEVYAARRHDDDLPGAVKILHAQAAEREELLARFLREGELARRLASPYIVTVFEVGTMEDATPFIAMELLAGEDLAARLRRERILQLPQAVELVRHVGWGLAAAHAGGVIHRDLKPQNLFWAEQQGGGSWKILDFGVSKLQGSSGTITQQAIVGTPGYMSPEQATGKDTDPRCDVFSLGAVLYRSLTGRPPFGGSDLPQILFQIVYRSPLRPSEVLPGITLDVERVLAMALAKAPADRFATAAELVNALENAARGELSTEIRTKADALVAALPWGAERPSAG